MEYLCIVMKIKLLFKLRICQQANLLKYTSAEQFINQVFMSTNFNTRKNAGKIVTKNRKCATRTVKQITFTPKEQAASMMHQILSDVLRVRYYRWMESVKYNNFDIQRKHFINKDIFKGQKIKGVGRVERRQRARTLDPYAQYSRARLLKGIIQKLNVRNRIKSIISEQNVLSIQKRITELQKLIKESLLQKQQNYRKSPHSFNTQELMSQYLKLKKQLDIIQQQSSLGRSVQTQMQQISNSLSPQQNEIIKNNDNTFPNLKGSLTDAKYEKVPSQPIFPKRSQQKQKSSETDQIPLQILKQTPKSSPKQTPKHSFQNYIQPQNNKNSFHYHQPTTIDKNKFIPRQKPKYQKNFVNNNQNYQHNIPHPQVIHQSPISVHKPPILSPPVYSHTHAPPQMIGVTAKSIQTNLNYNSPKYAESKPIFQFSNQHQRPQKKAQPILKENPLPTKTQNINKIDIKQPQIIKNKAPLVHKQALQNSPAKVSFNVPNYQKPKYQQKVNQYGQKIYIKKSPPKRGFLAKQPQKGIKTTKNIVQNQRISSSKQKFYSKERNLKTQPVTQQNSAKKRQEYSMQISFKNEEKTQEKRKSSNPDKGKGLKLLSALPYRKSKEKEHMIVTISSPKRFCNICGRNCKCGKI